MKKLALIIITAIITAAGPSLYAKGGFSIGVFGAYSIDGGAIENSINDAKYTGDYLTYGAYIESEYDPVIIPGAGLFIGYIFSSGFSMRIGSEMYNMVSGGNVYKKINTPSHDFNIEYEAAAFPLLIGFTASPDKGRTNIYGYTGIIFSMIDIMQNYEFNDGASVYKYEEDEGTFIPGFAALFGIEKRIFNKFYILFEYAFYKCEKSTNGTGNYYLNGSWMSDYEYNRIFGLPRHQARIGLRYQF